MLELNHFYNMDCMDGMRQFPDKYFDLAIVDPPYGIKAPGMNMGSNPNRKGHGNGIGTATRLKRKIKKDWDNQAPNTDYFKELFRVSKNQIVWGGNYFSLPPTKCVICWDKIQSWDAFSQWEMAWTSFYKPATIFKYCNRGESQKIHPTQKPVALYTWLLKNYAKPCDKILDTHAGSASSLIACHEMGFGYVGFEIDLDYYNSANERLEAVKAQQSLF